jgi:hypothetical protein
LEIQAEMALGGGFAPAMFGPVQGTGHQLDGGGTFGITTVGAADELSDPLAIIIALRTIITPRILARGATGDAYVILAIGRKWPCSNPLRRLGVTR